MRSNNMSQAQNLDIAQQFLARMRQGAAPEEIAALFHANVEWEIAGDVGALPGLGRKTGRGAVTGFIRDTGLMMQRISFSVHDVLASDSRAVIVGELATKLNANGKVIETAFAIILTITDGAIYRFQMLEAALRCPRRQEHRKSGGSKGIVVPTLLSARADLKVSSPSAGARTELFPTPTFRREWPARNSGYVRVGGSRVRGGRPRRDIYIEVGCDGESAPMRGMECPTPQMLAYGIKLSLVEVRRVRINHAAFVIHQQAHVNELCRFRLKRGANDLGRLHLPLKVPFRVLG
jgi:ketosteroid isomerase-like protein